jgi:probable F420-dependent oxidoreductase
VDLDVMTEPAAWGDVQALARDVEAAGFSGMVFTEMRQPPWISVVAAHHAAPSLQLSTGVAVAFPRSPMITAQTAWELAEATGGRFRLGVGSQVRGSVERRYASPFEPPVGRLRDYVQAVKACWRAFRGDTPLAHEGPHYRLTHLPPVARPRRHHDEDLRIDIAAVGPTMVRAAGEVADGVHVHPMHSVHYLQQRLLPALAEGTAKAGRRVEDVALLIPVMAAPGDTPEERAPLVQRCRGQLAFYGATRNYAFQFDDLGFEGTTEQLAARFKAGDLAGGAATITDEMLDHFAIVCRWDELADRLGDRYGSLATRLIMYTAADDLRRDPARRGRWAEVAQAVRA